MSLWSVLLSTAAWADLRERYDLPDGGRTRRFVIATDEARSRNAQKKGRRLILAGPLTPEAARQSAVQQAQAAGEEADLVLYEEGRPRNVANRRFLTRQLAVKLQPGANPAALAAKFGLIAHGAAAGAPGWQIFSATKTGGTLDVLDALVKDPSVALAEPQLARQMKKRSIPNDPFFTTQWHLRNTGQSGGLANTDANVTSVWDTWKGTGVRIGIVDDGLQTTHPDLSPNVDLLNDHDWNDTSPNTPDPDVTEDDHGTACAGVAAGRGNNGIGISGAAPEATLVGLRLIAAPSSDQEEAEAMAWKNDVIQLKSNSWGPEDDGFTLEAPGSLMTDALASGAQNGRGGKGTIYLWAAGNGGDLEDNSNYDGYANSIYTIAVAAVNNRGKQSYYSEPGANVLITAPSNGRTSLGELGIVTADLVGGNGYNNGADFSEPANADYTNSFGGTSSACPLAAGVVALILQANPNLGWRDVQEILIRSATKVDPTDTDWSNNAAGYHFNHKYGAGLINAQAAVNLATSWTNLGTYQNLPSAQTGFSVTIPDNNPAGTDRIFTLASNLRVERVTVKVNISHAYRGDLAITLTSPSGTVSRLAEEHGDPSDNYANWTFSTVRCWGENAVGTWTLRVADTSSGTAGTLTAATLTVYGGPANEPPAVTAASVTPAGPVFFDQTLTVGGVTATDPEGDAITFGYQWQQSVDGNLYSPISGATNASLALSSEQSGKFVRCAVRGISLGFAGAPFYPTPVAVNRRPVEFARSGQPYSYDSDLLSAGGVIAARTLLINEFSQGTSGSKEWIELLLLKTADLRGYTLRSGNSTYVTFASVPAWSAVPAGTLVVIYNSGDRDTTLPADDVDPFDFRMVVPINNTTLFAAGATWSPLSNSVPLNLNLRDAAAVVVDGISTSSSTTYTPSVPPVGFAKAAAFNGGSDAAAETAANWEVINATAATPGSANGGANTTFITGMRGGAPFQFASTSDVVPGLAVDPISGVLSGTPNVPSGGLFTIVLERPGSPAISQTFPLLVADANGHYVIPAGKTLTLDQPLTLDGSLTVLGTLNTAGFALAVEGEISQGGGASVSNATGSIGYLLRSGPALPGTTLLLANAANDAADQDGDSVVNLLEFKLGMDPSQNTLLGLPQISRVNGHLTLTYSTPVGASGVNATVEVSGNLTFWQTGAGATEVVSDTAVGGIRTVVVRDVSTEAIRFIRLKAHR